MAAFSYYNTQELDKSIDVVREVRSQLVELVAEANSLIKDGPKFALFARKQQPTKKWFWSKPIVDVYIELLFGHVQEDVSELQILNFHSTHFEAVLMGFITGQNIAAQYGMKPDEAWDKFIDHLGEVDNLPEAKNFMGSIARYKKIFLDANK